MENLGIDPEAPATTDVVRAAVAAEREAALEQLVSAWHLHVARVEEALHRGWRDQFERICEERFAALAGILEPAFETALASGVVQPLESAQADARAQAAAEAAGRFCRIARRMRQAENRAGALMVLLEACPGLCKQAAIFEVRGPTLVGLWHVREGEPPAAFQGIETALAQAPAFETSIETADTVIALRTAAELSRPVAEALGELPEGKAWLVPIAAGSRVVAVLYADNGEGPVETAELELLVHLVAAALAGFSAPAGLVSLSPGRSPEANSGRAADPPPLHRQEAHLRAQRLARVRVAEWSLYRAGQVSAGRTGGNIYTELKHEIDSAREEYRREFIEPSPAMADYLHTELVRTIANDDEQLLGPDYPGPLA
jgi:hypothetical protein